MPEIECNALVVGVACLVSAGMPGLSVTRKENDGKQRQSRED